MYDVIIVGAGPAGLSAGIYALRAGLDTLILDKSVWGGQTVLSAEIENYPAVPSVTGPDFAQRMYEQLVKLGGAVKLEEVVEINTAEKTVKTANSSYQAKAVIIAAGLRRRVLGCRGEAELTGRGVSYCAVCDGRFFSGKDVVVAGGGNTALEDALFMSSYCRSITILCRGDRMKGEEALKESVSQKENIKILYNTQIEEIQGDSAVEAALLSDGTLLKTSAVFVAIGYEADSTFLKGQVQMTEEGYVIAGEDCRTSQEGVFIAGDLRTKSVRQIVTAAADGAVAALGAADLVLKM